MDRDDASMASTIYLSRLVAAARQKGSGGILAGDPHQIVIAHVAKDALPVKLSPTSTPAHAKTRCTSG